MDMSLCTIIRISLRKRETHLFYKILSLTRLNALAVLGLGQDTVGDGQRDRLRKPRTTKS